MSADDVSIKKMTEKPCFLCKSILGSNHGGYRQESQLEQRALIVFSAGTFKPLPSTIRARLTIFVTFRSVVSIKAKF